MMESVSEGGNGEPSSFPPAATETQGMRPPIAKPPPELLAQARTARGEGESAPRPPAGPPPPSPITTGKNGKFRDGQPVRRPDEPPPILGRSLAPIDLFTRSIGESCNGIRRRSLIFFFLSF